MAKLDIPFLVIKRRGARLLHYWQPSAAMKRAGWKSQSFGSDPDVAVRAALARNQELEAWKQGKATRAGVRRAARARSFGDIIRRYQASPAFTDLKPGTREVYAVELRKLDAWAGDYQVEDVTPRAAQALYDVLRRPPAGKPIERAKARYAFDNWNLSLGAPVGEDRAAAVIAAFDAALAAQTPVDAAKAGQRFETAMLRMTNAVSPAEIGLLFERLFAACERLHSAHRVMRVLSAVWKYAASEQIVSIASNPAPLVRKKTPRPRYQIWAEGAVDVAIAAADGYIGGNDAARPRRSIGDALLLAHEIGQREADILALTWAQWDGTHLRLRQQKTGAWIRLKATAPLAARLGDIDAANRARPQPSMHIIVNEETGRRYKDATFQRKLREVLVAAIDAGAAELDGLEYRDLRRTAVVRLGETGMELQLIAAVSGHSIEVTKTILEVYMPRTGKMADAAIEQLEAHRAKLAKRDRT